MSTGQNTRKDPVGLCARCGLPGRNERGICGDCDKARLARSRERDAVPVAADLAARRLARGRLQAADPYKPGSEAKALVSSSAITGVPA